MGGGGTLRAYLKAVISVQMILLENLFFLENFFFLSFSLKKLERSYISTIPRGLTLESPNRQLHS